MKKVYVVMGHGWIVGVYTDKETAQKVAEHETWCAGCEGSNTVYGVWEQELIED